MTTRLTPHQFVREHPNAQLIGTGLPNPKKPIFNHKPNLRYYGTELLRLWHGSLQTFLAENLEQRFNITLHKQFYPAKDLQWEIRDGLAHLVLPNGLHVCYLITGVVSGACNQLPDEK